MSISHEAIVVATDSQVSTALGAETVILDFNKGSYFGLNEVGTTIWSRLNQPQSVRELCNAVLAEYEVDPDTCQRDVLMLLEELRKKGLIEVRGEPAA
jgi:hypothetical protein